jgi:hypothetical protein
MDNSQRENLNQRKRHKILHLQRRGRNWVVVILNHRLKKVNIADANNKNIPYAIEEIVEEVKVVVKKAKAKAEKIKAVAEEVVKVAEKVKKPATKKTTKK